ncbi:uroporphyrinogen-III C-methyltransferase [Porticoccaceae bacterium]|nr:uroporphyrinogen-III C-methyltransferase [Porticoccaceae bacterium]MDA8944490.1 uroporphyrinogen-III C-methyltransferase [Porticoccaceae bacterium]
MTEKTKPEAKPKTAKVEKNKVVKKEKPTTKPKSGVGFFKVLGRLVFLLFLAGISVAGWIFWQDWQQKTQNITANSLTIGSISPVVMANQQQSQISVKQSLEQQQNIFNLESQIQNLQLRINAQGARLVELGSTTRSDWLLAEAEYLARLAKQRLQTERNTKSPLALLESVDAILQQIDEPNLIEVRGAVAADITALRLVNDIDKQGVYVELNALTASIKKLEVMEADKPLELAKEAKQQNTPLDVGVLDKFLADFSGLIRVRERQSPIEPILERAEEQTVRQNLQMMLEQAQLALLREEQVIYQQSLVKAQEYLQRFFKVTASAEGISQRLQRLADTNIIQQLPSIHSSLEAVQNLLVVRQQRLLDSKRSDQVEPQR